MTDTTHKAPERIWALHNYVAGVTNILSGHIMLEPTEIAETTEYVRADLVQAAVAAALREAAKEAKTYFIGAGGEDIAGREVRAGAEISRAILDLITPDAQAALDRLLAAERERCAKVVETEGLYYAGLREGTILDRVAAAILKGEE